MRVLLAFSMAFGVMGCGDLNVTADDPQVNVSNGSTATADFKWSEADMAGEVSECRKAVMAHDNAWTPATDYCTCMIEHIARKMAYKEFAVNFDAVLDEMDANGTSSACARQAGVTKKKEKAASPASTPPPPAPAPEEEEEPAVTGKLKKGMAKDDVRAIFGTPKTVSTNFDGSTQWEYEKGEEPCAEEYIDCRIMFDKKTGLVIAQSYVDAEYIDLGSF